MNKWWMLVKVAVILGISFAANRILQTETPGEGEYPGDCPVCGKPQHLEPTYFEGYGCRDCTGAKS